MATEEITQLIKDSQSGDPEKQIAAIERLNDLEAFEAAPTMIQVLSSDPNWKVRSAAIYTLNQLEAVEAIPLLIQVLLSDPNMYVRESAAFILKFLGEDQLEIYPIGPALLNALDDGDGGVRNEAVVALGYHHYLPAANRLRELLHTDAEWYVRASAAEALARMHDEASLTDLEQAITDPDPQVQRAVIIALRQFLDAPTVAPLVTQQLTRWQLDPIVKAELLAITYRLGQLSHLQDLLVILNQAEDSEVATEILMVLVDLTEENPPADLKNHQEAIQTVLQQFLSRHLYLQSDVKRVQDNLMRLEG